MASKPTRPGADLRSLAAWWRLAAATAAGLAILAYFASGFFFVEPDERGVVRRFGRVVEGQAAPGLHYAWPPPFGRVDRPKTTEIKRVVVGLDPDTRAAIVAGDLVAQTRSALTDVFTGDVNILKATMVALYQITEADRYVTRTVDPERLVRLAVQSVMLETLGGYSIDVALTEGKAQIQNRTRERAQAMLEQYGCGVTLREVTLEGLEPPHAIADAFRDVASARKDWEKAVDQAESFANSILAKARGIAYEMLADARGYQQRRIQQALGEADRFRSLHAEYVKAPQVTRTRLLLGTLSTVFERAQTYVVSPNTGGPPLRITIGDGRKQ